MAIMQARPLCAKQASDSGTGRDRRCICMVFDLWAALGFLLRGVFVHDTVVIFSQTFSRIALIEIFYRNYWLVLLL